MLAQTFQYPDLITIVALVVLEGLLSADNALVLAIMVRHLPEQRQQRRALTIGLAMSFVFRFWLNRNRTSAYSCGQYFPKIFHSLSSV